MVGRKPPESRIRHYATQFIVFDRLYLAEEPVENLYGEHCRGSQFNSRKHIPKTPADPTVHFLRR